MDSTDVVALVEETWKNAHQNCKVAALRTVRRAVPDEHIPLFDCLLDNKINGIEDDPTATILFLVHGIQTDGAWQKHVQSELSDTHNINIIGIGYNCVTAAQLVSPFRSTPVEKVAREIRDAKRREPVARLMVIAHSFGSYIISRLLKSHPDIEFERIILCGSIIPRDFQWDVYAKYMQRGAIVNDVGTRDFYPVLATFASLGYGASGRLGFNTGAVVDRYFCYAHSDFFEKKRGHIRRFWKPFLVEGRIKDSPWDTRKPKTGLSILLLSHPWIGRPLALFVLLAMGWIGSSLV